MLATTSLAALAALRITTDVRSVVGEDELTYCSAPATPSRGPVEKPLQLADCVAELKACGAPTLGSLHRRLKYFEVRYDLEAQLPRQSPPHALATSAASALPSGYPPVGETSPSNCTGGARMMH